MKQAIAKVFIDNERVRVTERRFAPGAATGWHRHQFDYVAVPLLYLFQGLPYFRDTIFNYAYFRDTSIFQGHHT